MLETKNLFHNCFSNSISEEILLVIAPPWGVHHPPMFLGYLARYLKDRKIGYKIFDLNMELFKRADTNQKKLWKVENDYIWRNTPPHEMMLRFNGLFDLLINKIIDFDIPLIGFSMVDPNQYITCEVIKKIKEKCPQKLIVAGGPICATLNERKWLKNNTKNLIDFIVVGEGEKPLTELIIQKNTSTIDVQVKIHGLLDCRFDNSMELPSLPNPLDLSKIAFPDYDGFDLNAYEAQVVSVMWSRGCISNCAFCKEKSLWERYRTRTIESILKEIRFYQNKNINEFVVFDSLVNGNPKHLEALCDAIILQNLNIRWSALAIPNKYLTGKLLKKMKRAGCFVLIFGVESGSEKVLKLMRKKYFLPDAIQTIKNTKSVGIKTAVNILIGFPGEYQEDFKKTLNFLHDNYKYIDRIDSVTPLQLVRGTYLFNHYQEFGIRIPKKRENEYWYTQDGLNTYETRRKRCEQVIDICNKYDLEVWKTFTNKKNSDKEEHKIAKEVPKITIKRKHEYDILFFNPFYHELPDYDTACLIEYLLDHNFKAGHITKDSDSESKEKLLSKLAKSTFKILAIKIIDAYLEATLEIVNKIINSNHEFKIIFWGSGCRTEGQRKNLPLEPIDGVIFQGYESTFKELLLQGDQILSGKPIQGIYFHKAPYIPRKPVENISAYPFPRYKKFKLKNKLSLKLSKGCPYRCTFCSSYYEEGAYRVRSPQIVFQEIFYHYKQNNISHYLFQDCTIGGNPSHLDELGNLLIKENFPITWEARNIVVSRQTDLPFQKMAHAGCKRVTFGFVSGSDRVLQLMGKPFDVDSLKKFLKDAKQVGIQTSINLMVGFPGEDEIDLKKTAHFLKENRKFIDNIDQLTPCCIQPGCDLEMYPEKYNIILPHHDHWRDWHNGSFNNYSHRLKKMKEMAILLSEFGIIQDIELYVKK